MVGIDPEARIYLVMVLMLLALLITTNTVYGCVVRRAEREERAAKRALARAVKEERAAPADIDDHFAQTPAGRHARYSVGVANPDTTLVHHFGFGEES